MIKTIITTLTLIFSLSLTASNGPTHGGEIDLTKSTISWLGKKVVGQHSGTIALKSGNLEYNNHKLTGGKFVIDMTTIKCTDMEGEKAAGLEGHLSNEDFFQVDKFPTSELVITNVKAKESGTTYSVTGNLTIKGVTKPITFDAETSDHSAKATIKVDRVAYGIKYGSGSFFDNLGDKAIDNNFTLTVNLVIK